MNRKYKILISIFAVMLVSLSVGLNVKTAVALGKTNIKIVDNTITKGEPGIMTVENEIKTALMPVGKCLYIYGGGWNENEDPSREDCRADTGANDETKTIGVPKIWENFYASQNSNYTPWDVDDLDFEKNPPCVHWGVDCSGYLGWVLQNITSKTNGFDTNALNNEGWVTYAQWIGFGLQHLNYGERLANPKADIIDNPEDPYEPEVAEADTESNLQYSYVPGNIYTFGKSGEYHCWLCLGQCNDGSVLLLHCSDPGIFICGTSPNYNENDPHACTSEALEIARTYMKRYYTDFYNKFGVIGKPGKIENDNASGYLKYSEFNWDESKLTDESGLRSLNPHQLMEKVYCETTSTANLKSTGQVPVLHFNDALVEPSSSTNSSIIYNRETVSDTNVKVNFQIPAGYKFDSISINGVDYTNALQANSNLADISVPISQQYDIVTASSSFVENSPSIEKSVSEVVSETAKTYDFSYYIIFAAIIIAALSVVFVVRKD